MFHINADEFQKLPKFPSKGKIIRCLIFLISWLWCASVWAEDYSHALSLFRDIKYAKDFKYFDYAHPDAPKGGTLKLSSTGGFDSLNPFNGMGLPAPALRLVYDTLMVRSLDEPATQYGLIAKSVHYASNDKSDYKWVEFHLNSHAKFADGKNITADDVIFSLNILKNQGGALYRYKYKDIQKAVKISEHKIRFIFGEKGNAALAMTLGDLPVLPKHFWHNKDFKKASLTFPLGSGPYKIMHLNAGRNITFERRHDYWAKDLNVNKGRYNFDHITFDMFRNNVTQFEAFKAGQHDYRIEFDIKNWMTAYDDAHKKIKRDIIKDMSPKPLSGLVFNLRQKIFQEPALRKAMMMVIDYEWLNNTLYFGQYKRAQSFFEASPLKAQTDAPPYDKRQNLHDAIGVLKQAGYLYQDGFLHDKDGTKITIEILNSDPSFERILLPIISSFKKIGIDAHIHNLDASSYFKRIHNFDFDMISTVYEQSSSPNQDQENYWGSIAATTHRSRNYAGLSDPVIDALIDKLGQAKDRDALTKTAQSLDRALQSKHFIIPLFYDPASRIAYYDKFGKPKVSETYGFPSPINLWWAQD